MVLFGQLDPLHLCVPLVHLFHYRRSYQLARFHQLVRCGRLVLYLRLNRFHQLDQLHLFVPMVQLFHYHLLDLIVQMVQLAQ